MRFKCVCFVYLVFTRYSVFSRPVANLTRFVRFISSPRFALLIVTKFRAVERSTSNVVERSIVVVIVAARYRTHSTLLEVEVGYARVSLSLLPSRSLCITAAGRARSVT